MMLNQLQTINACHMVPNKKAFILLNFFPLLSKLRSNIVMCKTNRKFLVLFLVEVGWLEVALFQTLYVTLIFIVNVPGKKLYWGRSHLWTISF